MLFKDRKVKELSKEKGIDERVVRLIADYPLKFARKKMADDNDWRPIMIRYFAKFVPKYKKQLDLDKKAIEDKEEKSVIS